MKKGKIIVIEGTDCSGKETQSNLLINSLEKEKIKVKRFAFPMYDTPTGKIVGGPYLGKEEISASYFEEGSANVDPYVSCLYYAADRKYNINTINAYIEKGYIVILDRYITSNMAHQGGKLNNKKDRIKMYEWIDKLEYQLLDLPQADLTIFLHMPYEYSKNLSKNRKSLDGNEKDPSFMKNSEKAYLELVELYNWKKIECVSQSKIRKVEDIQKEIYDIVKEYIA